MDIETKKKLLDAGRTDLVDAYYIMLSGFAGVDKKGMIVDRREFPEAQPCPEHKEFGLPAPKILKLLDLDLGCKECMYALRYLDKSKWGDVCGACGRDLNSFRGMEL